MINIKDIVFNKKIVIISGICLCLLASIHYFYFKIYFDTAKTTTATVTDIQVRYSHHSHHSRHRFRSSSSSKDYYYYISYIADGKEYDNVDIGRQRSLSKTIGEKVMVYYHSYAPDHAKPYKNHSFTSLILLIAGIAVIVFGINSPEKFTITYW